MKSKKLFFLVSLNNDAFLPPIYKKYYNLTPNPIHKLASFCKWEAKVEFPYIDRIFFSNEEPRHSIPLNADSFSIQALPSICYAEDKVFQDCADLGLNQE